MTCDYSSIQISENKCNYILENCGYSYINFYSLFYCTLNSNYFLFLPIIIIIILICFYLLNDTSNKYLSSALTKISDKLKLSQNFSGITLLAFGNGAPDVISSIVASDLYSGIEFSVCALIGSGVFVTSFVMGVVIICGKEIKVNKNLFIRDISIYLISLIYFLWFSLEKQINLWMSISFFMIYVIFVIIASVPFKCKRKKLILEREDSFSLNFNNSVLNPESLAHHISTNLDGQKQHGSILDEHFYPQDDLNKISLNNNSGGFLYNKSSNFKKHLNTKYIGFVYRIKRHYFLNRIM